MNLKEVEIRKIEKLLASFIDDIEKGIDPKEAGWIEECNSDARMLIQMGFCEKFENKIRISLKPLPDDILKRIHRKNAWLAEAHKEIVKAISVERDIAKVINDNLTLPAIIYLGWKRMLNTSNFPLIIERILKEGFTLATWPQEIREKSDMLHFLSPAAPLESPPPEAPRPRTAA